MFQITNYGNRVKRAFFVGFLVAPLLIIAGSVLLVHNEQRSVGRERILNQGAHQVLTVGLITASPGADYENKLIHFSGMAVTPQGVTDPLLGVHAQALRLERKIEMYQWKETPDTANNQAGYRYEAMWSEQPISSSSFHMQEGHQNPAMPFRSESWQAADAHIGNLQLTASVLKVLHPFDLYPLPSETYAHLPQNVQNDYHQLNNVLYRGANPAAPAVGDIKVHYEIIAPQTVSIIAKLSQDTAVAYDTDNGALALAERGIVDPDTMFKHAQKENTLLTWGMRFVGTCLVMIGFALLFGTLSALVSFIPILGSIAGFLIDIGGMVIGGALALIIIALSWIAYRPLLALVLIAAAISGIFFRYQLRRNTMVSPIKAK